MTICTTCQRDNRPGVLVCEGCGAVLVSTRRGKTETIQLEDVPQFEAVGASKFEAGDTLLLHIRSLPLPMRVRVDGQMLVGVFDTRTGAKPDIDLTVYEGVRMGVSRLHATLTLDRGGLYISDNGSSNGTTLNGQKLEPNRATQLRDGDELRLGAMVIRVVFGGHD